MHSKRVFLHVVTQGQAFCHIVVLPIPNISEFPTAEKSQKKACSPLKRLSLDVALFMLTFRWWKLRLLIVSNEVEESTLNCYSGPNSVTLSGHENLPSGAFSCRVISSAMGRALYRVLFYGEFEVDLGEEHRSPCLAVMFALWISFSLFCQDWGHRLCQMISIFPISSTGLVANKTFSRCLRLGMNR